MTPFETLYRALLPFEHPLYQFVWRELRAIVRSTSGQVQLLDVGGRRSNYTIALPVDVTITDVPRTSQLDHDLDLGATTDMVSRVRGRRSNVLAYALDDMTHTGLPARHYDIVTAFEVLEHVENDQAFIDGVVKVLRPNGVFFMSTPNGDYIPRPYKQHVRHYRAEQLRHLLATAFADVDIRYRVNNGWPFSLGLHRWSARTPVRTLFSMAAFRVCDVVERFGIGGSGPEGKLHLTALCRRPRQNAMQRDGSIK